MPPEAPATLNRRQRILDFVRQTARHSRQRRDLLRSNEGRDVIKDSTTPSVAPLSR